MFLDNLPLFGEEKYFNEVVNSGRRIISIPDTTKESFCAYKKLIEDNGFSAEEKRKNEKLDFIAYKKDDSGIFVNYFFGTNELQIVTEEKCNYFDFCDKCGKNIVSPQITQVHLEDFGMSYAIRLSDGRFIIIDGGMEFVPDAKRLFECLKNGSPFNKPIIAAWIMSHPHSDHFHCFIPFMELFADEVIVEKMMFNFPEANDLAHYPALEEQDPRFKDNAETIFLPKFLKKIEQLGIPVYTPHTGQSYTLGDARLCVLASMDDTIHCSQDINASSLVIKMELGEQTILWTADASFRDARLCQRYGNQLKVDILQIPHHGFSCGCSEAEIEGFELINPEVCLLPVIDFNAFTVIGIYRESTLHLMTRMRVSELITGENTTTITLPYSPVSWGKEELRQNVDEGFKRAGAKNWIFTDLSTSKQEDFIFTFLNAAGSTAEINAELFFEDPNQRVRFIKITVPEGCFKTVCIINTKNVQSETHYFNCSSLETMGVPQNVPFAVRFISNFPVVISKKGHEAAYKA